MGEIIEGVLHCVRDVMYFDDVVIAPRKLDPSDFGDECRERDNVIECMVAGLGYLDKGGQSLLLILRKYHGKRVRINIEAVE